MNRHFWKSPTGLIWCKSEPFTRDAMIEIGQLVYKNDPTPISSSHTTYYRHAEKVVCSRLEQDGCRVTKSGWPDLFVEMPDGSVRFIEVKANVVGQGKEPLSKQQQIMHALLKKYFGIEVEVVYVDYDREKIHDRSHR